MLPEGPVDVAWDKSPCSACSMHVGEPPFAAQLTTTSGKTHVFDVANRPWLLPFIYDRATSGPERELLGELMRLANQRRPKDRPSFAELVDRIDRFATRPRH